VPVYHIGLYLCEKPFPAMKPIHHRKGAHQLQIINQNQGQTQTAS